MNISLQSRYVTRRDAYDTFLYKNHIKEKSDCTCFFSFFQNWEGHCKPMTFVSLHAEDGQPQQEEILHTEIASSATATLTHW